MKMKLLLPLAGLVLAAGFGLTGCVTYTVVTPPPGPTLAQVQTMSQAHVSDAVIVSQIQNSTTRYQLTADQIIALKKAGVSDAVLNALINTASKPVPQPTTTVYPDSYAYPYYYPYGYVGPWGWWGGPYYYGGHYRGGYYRR